MRRTDAAGRRPKFIWGILLLALVVALGGFAGARRVSGQGLGLTRFVNIGKALLNRGSVLALNRGNYTHVIFLHHSVGNNLIEQGDLRGRLAAAGMQLSDHGYNYEGLRRPDGSYAGYSYNVPDDNTDPSGLANIFEQKVYDLPLNTLSDLLQYEVVVLKSCYPNSDIRSDAQLAQMQADYLRIRAVMDRHPDKLFIVVTQPPLNPAATDLDTARRARALAEWLKSDNFVAGHANLAVYDLFDQLAEGDASASDANMLRNVYRDGADAHPNRAANERIAPLLADFVAQTAGAYRARLH
jgi:hypothetical protein